MDLAQAKPLLLDRLADLFGAPAAVRDHDAVDLLVEVGGRLLAVEFVAQAGAAHVGQAIRQLQDARSSLPAEALRLVAVPYLGEVGQRLCAEASLAWLDLSGNARIVTPELRIQIAGQPNRFKRPGRPPDLFSPVRSRVVRCLLLEPARVWQQRELFAATGLDPGYLSRTLRDLVSAGLIHRGADRVVSVPDPELLLDAWHAAYDFGQHRRWAGHVAARSGEALLDQLADYLPSVGVEYALTALAAAWHYAPMAAFRLVTVYVADLAAVEASPPAGFRNEPLGANLWLVQPSDPGVFDGVEVLEGWPCVHPVQVYLDLQAHAERAAEAAEELCRVRLTWSRNA